MNENEKVEIFNKQNVIGTKVVYWPYLLNSHHRDGQRTKTTSNAFLSQSGAPVVFVEGINGYVHIGCIEIGSLMPTDSKCFSETFNHIW